MPGNKPDKGLDTTKSIAVYKLISLANKMDPLQAAMYLYMAVMISDNSQHAKALLNRANTLAAKPGGSQQ